MIGVSQISVVAFRGGGGSAPNPDFISTWDTTKAGSASDTVVLPLLSGGTYSGTIDWGDGSTSALSYANRTHVYAVGGTYTITISGSDIQGFAFNASGDSRKIIDISNWGNLTITTNRSFYGCNYLDISATDAPTIATTNLSMTFRSCNISNFDASRFDVSGVTDLSYMFGSSSFNGNINNWDVSSCTNMQGMFSYNSAYNQPLDNWDVSNVVLMGATTGNFGMFLNASAFNQNINNWNVSNVTTLTGMFSGATSFNQPLNNWNCISNGSIAEMFYNASSFNQDITNIVNTSNITSLKGVFFGATSFNQDVSGWDVSTVTDFARLFRNCNAAGFNPDVTGWNTSSLTSVSDGAGGTFQNTDGLDRDLSGWDITSMNSALYFMWQATGLSTANYDATLVGWEAQLQATWPGGVGYPYTININFGGSKYTSAGAGGTARTSLISIFGWTITDGGGV